MNPRNVEKYITEKLEAHLDDACGAIVKLANSIQVHEINLRAFGLYTRFRPNIPEGVERQALPER